MATSATRSQTVQPLWALTVWDRFARALPVHFLCISRTGNHGNLPITGKQWQTVTRFQVQPAIPCPRAREKGCAKRVQWGSDEVFFVRRDGDLERRARSYLLKGKREREMTDE